MRDLEKFSVEENLRGRDYCLNDDIEKDDIDIVIFNISYFIDRFDKCRGNLYGIVLSGVNITK